ncbi:MAG: hypothetical protein ACYCST_17025 [Acidimicrobiales bacterium]
MSEVTQGQEASDPVAGRAAGKRKRALAGAVAALVVALALICAVVAGSPASGVSAGHGSPADAVTGFLDAFLVQTDASAACAFVVPDEQRLCSADVGYMSGGSYGKFEISAVDMQGTQALVGITGRICGALSSGQGAAGCTTTSNPRAGFPRRGRSFQQAYVAAISASSRTEPCSEVGGLWYVNLG